MTSNRAHSGPVCIPALLTVTATLGLYFFVFAVAVHTAFFVLSPRSQEIGNHPKQERPATGPFKNVASIPTSPGVIATGEDTRKAIRPGGDESGD